MGAPAGAGAEATTAGYPCPPSSVSAVRISTERPRSRARPATASALAVTWDGSKLGHATEGIATRSLSWSRTSSKISSTRAWRWAASGAEVESLMLQR
ncbi:Uncharacterised protein [Mycobacteroides abscessus subsp. abscessus]|nr:Uncharacterised protein [Mycobacteroides abscessus subsp. abscessus]